MLFVCLIWLMWLLYDVCVLVCMFDDVCLCVAVSWLLFGVCCLLMFVDGCCCSFCACCVLLVAGGLVAGC